MNNKYDANEIAQLKKIIAEQENIIANQNQKISYLETIIDIIPCNVYWKDREGYYQGCNKNNLRIGGLTSLQDFIGKKIDELIDQPYADEIGKVDEEIMISGKEKILEENWIDINGQSATYLTHKIPIFDDNGNVTGLLGVSFNITSRKKIESELKVMKALAEEQSKITHIYLNNLVASLPENFYWIDKESRVLVCNENQARILGLTSSQLIGKNNHDIAKMVGWDKKIADNIRKNDLEVMETRQTKKTEETVWLNGEKKTFLSYKYPLIDDKHEVIGLFGVGIDITERKRMEEELMLAKEKAELADQAKSQFITNMSHDIRTPFSGILGFTNILLKKETDSQKKEMLNHIIYSSEKLLNLLNEILDLAKNTQKKICSSIKFNLQQTVNETIGVMLAEIKFKNLQLKINVQQDLPGFLQGDKLKFDRILLNLISNAVKFTSKGYIAVDVTAISKNSHEILLQIRVKDSGIGIPADKYETIFEHFSRLTPAYEGNYQGSGLGLYMVKQFVNELGGEISVSSKMAKGTTFTCTLPFKVAQEHTVEYLREIPQNTQLFSAELLKNSQKYILLIEDDPIAQKISKIMLQDYFGCVVDIAATGQRALEMIKENQYDSILMDIGLPDIDGFNLAKKIRAFGSTYAHIPIFGLTAHTDEASLPLAQDATMNIVLTKPLSEEICVKIFSTIS